MTTILNVLDGPRRMSVEEIQHGWVAIARKAVVNVKVNDEASKNFCWDYQTS